MERGEVWSVSFPLSGGREQSGERPALVVQDAAYGESSPLILVVPLTSQLAALRFPASVQIDPSDENGLSVSSVAMVFQTRALDRSRFRNKLGEITEGELGEILGELNRLTGQ